MSKSHDLTNLRFGKLLAVRPLDERDGKQIVWECTCDCGRVIKVKSYPLSQGKITDCGCVPKQPNGQRGCIARGSAQLPEYLVWAAMHRRCSNPKDRAYHRYGGRGIKVCERWRIFEHFLEDMGRRPDGMQIDRKDNNGDYCKDNCRWATSHEQQNNRSDNRTISLNGVTLTLSEWAVRMGLKYTTLRNRLNAGWDKARALDQDVRKHKEYRL